MTDNLPPLPPCAPEFKPRWDTDPGGYNEDQMKAYARAAIEKDRERQNVPASQDAANLLARYERQWHRMGELWERHQGKGWPAKEGAEFAQLRDERAPATRAALLAFLAAPQPQPVQQEPVAWYEHNPDLDAWFLAYTKNPSKHIKSRPLVFGDVASPQAAQPLSDEQSRAAFEAFVSSELGDVAVMDQGRYMSPKIQNYWRIWQAAHGITKGTT